MRPETRSGLGYAVRSVVREVSDLGGGVVDRGRFGITEEGGGFEERRDCVKR